MSESSTFPHIFLCIYCIVLQQESWLTQLTPQDKSKLEKCNNDQKVLRLSDYIENVSDAKMTVKSIFPSFALTNRGG